MLYLSFLGGLRARSRDGGEETSTGASPIRCEPSPRRDYTGLRVDETRILILHIIRPHRALAMCNIGARTPAFRLENRSRPTPVTRVADVPAIRSPEQNAFAGAMCKISDP